MVIIKSCGQYFVNKLPEIGATSRPGQYSLLHTNVVEDAFIGNTQIGLLGQCKHFINNNSIRPANIHPKNPYFIGFRQSTNSSLLYGKSRGFFDSTSSRISNPPSRNLSLRWGQSYLVQMITLYQQTPSVWNGSLQNRKPLPDIRFHGEFTIHQ